MASINLGRVQGYSAYEIAVQNGYTGTEQEWLASLKGTNGTNGTDGVSPAVTVARNQEDTGAVITVTDANGTTTATVNDGTTPSLTGYATETYVDNAIADIDIPANTSDLNNDSGFITSADLSGYAQTSSLATVATSGSYADLTNKPTIPDVSGLATETYVDNAVAGIVVPTATSDLTNDSGFITANDLAAVATSGDYDDLANKPTIPAAPGIATTTDAGLVKPDGTTITIDANGVISSSGSGSSITPDGETIIEDGGVISTAIGGSKIQEWGKTLFYEWNSTDYPNATLTQDENNIYIKLSTNSGHFLNNMDYFGGSASNVGNWVNLLNYLGASDYKKLTWYVEVTAEDDSVLSAELKFGSTSNENSVTAYVWNAADTGEIRNANLPQSQTYTDKAIIWIATRTSSNRTFKDLKVYINPKYSYEPIDANFISIDNSSIINNEGVLQTAFPVSQPITNVFKLDVQSGSLMLGDNSLSASGYERTFAFGSSNTINNGYRNVILGANNSTNGNYDGVVVGRGLKLNTPNQVVLGAYNNTSTAPFVIGMGTNASNRVDAMTIDASANTTFAGTVQATDFLDSNGDSIIGSGGDSLPTIKRGDAGKALVVNSSESGVEWGGSVPVDPEASSKNVYTGDGYWNNAWYTVQDAATNELRIEGSFTPRDDVFTIVAEEEWPLFTDDSVSRLKLILEGDTAGGEPAYYEGYMSHTEVNGYAGNDFNLVQAQDGLTYTLTRVQYEASTAIETINYFTIEYDAFGQEIYGYVNQSIPQLNINSTSEYLSVDYLQDGNNIDYMLTPVTYPSSKQEESMYTTWIFQNVCEPQTESQGVRYGLVEIELSNSDWQAWLNMDGRRIDLCNSNHDIFYTIYIDDTHHQGYPYMGNDGEQIVEDRETVALLIPNLDYADAQSIAYMDLYTTTMREYGLVTYDTLSEVTSNPPSLPLSWLDESTRETTYDTQINNGIFFVQQNTRENQAAAGEEEDWQITDVTTSIVNGNSVQVSWHTADNSEQAQAILYQDNLTFTNTDPRASEQYTWNRNGIELVDQTTGDKYRLTISNGQVVLTNMSL